MRKKISFLFMSLLIGVVAYAGTAPAALSLKGTALNESDQSMSMRLMGNTYELFTSLKTGTLSFEGDSSIPETSVTVEGELTPYYIRVNYDGTNPEVTVSKITKVILWIPWTNYTLGELTYKGNSTFEVENLFAVMSNWANDVRYRIRFHMENSFKTYGSYDGSNDLYPATNNQWAADDHGGDICFDIPVKYRDTNQAFKVKVVMDNQRGYYHRVTDYPEVMVEYPDYWEKQTAPLMTTWGENLTPEGLFDEYPRPQMERKQWVNLNGIWDFVKKDHRQIGIYDPNEVYNRKILVPFPIESALSGIMDIDYHDKDKSYTYKRTFTIPESMTGKQILLHFGAVDWRCVAFVNGKEVGMHEGGFDPFYFNITDALINSGEQELVVQVYDPTNGGQPRGKQSPTPGGIWYIPSSGIWQTVWMEGVEETHINDFTIVPDIDDEVVRITVLAEKADASTKVDIIVYDGETEITRKTAEIGKETSLPVSNPKLWSPDSPFLYNLKFELKKGNEILDEVDSYFGMRKIAIGKLRGKPFMYLNNEPVFHYGPLDQGYWPDGLFTAPGYDALKYDLDITKELGFNMTRKHIKTEPARWYYYCDVMGLLVWQDMVSPTNHLPGPGVLGDTDWIKSNFLRESENIVKSLKNHPCIVMWVPYNEDWGQFQETPEHTRNGVELIRSLDNTRLINQSSGWTNFELGDIIDNHSYSMPSLYDNPFNERANVCGETGGLGLGIEGHIWSEDTNPYWNAENPEHLTKLLQELNDIAFGLTPSGISGLVYTQITDVEEELNGLYTYDRKVSKMNDAQKSRFRNGVEKLQNKVLAFVLPTAVNSNNSIWYYTTGGSNYTVADGWNTEFDYDDSSWSRGAAGFGNDNPPGSRIRTEWKNETIYLRKTFTLDNLTDEQFNKMKLFIYHDEDFQVYINGVLAASGTGYITTYKEFEILEDAKATIRRNGENLIAVKCVQTYGGQYIDVGITIGEIPLGEDFGEEQPKTFIEVSTIEELNNIRNNLSGFYQLVNDIDLSNVDFAPIGTVNKPFTGYLNGNGYAIKKLKISNEVANNSNNNMKGLFGYVEGAYITDLEMHNPEITGYDNIAALVGSAKGVTIERVLVYKPVVKGNSNIGAIIGKTEEGIASGVIDSYVANGNVNAISTHVGGLIGMANDTRIVNSYFSGSIAAPNNRKEGNAGGIIGFTENIRVSLRGVASLAESVTGGTASHFVPRGQHLVETTNSFVRSDMQLSDYVTGDNGLGRAHEDMHREVEEFRKQTLFDAMGWDFENIWKMSENGFPVFKNGSFANNITLEKVNQVKNLNLYLEEEHFVLEAKEDSAIWIYDVAGTLVERFNLKGNRKVKLPSGGYVIKAVSESGIDTVKAVR